MSRDINVYSIVVGLEGERLCRRFLESIDGIRIVSDLRLPFRDRFTQIDMVAIYNTGVWCLEIKNYRGNLSGGSEDRFWRLDTNGRINMILNPIRQNEIHRESLKMVLRDDVPLFSRLVFCGTGVVEVSSDLVCSGVQLPNIIEGGRELLDDEDVRDIFEELESLKVRYGSDLDV